MYEVGQKVLGMEKQPWIDKVVIDLIYFDRIFSFIFAQTTGKKSWIKNEPILIYLNILENTIKIYIISHDFVNSSHFFGTHNWSVPFVE
jgi:hypothetical protein